MSLLNWALAKPAASGPVRVIVRVVVLGMGEAKEGGEG